MADKAQAFAVWITGLPASGKSTLAQALAERLTTFGIKPALLESDVLRPIFTPHAPYQEEDRDTFYHQLAYVGALLTRHGVPVVFDATANRRRYRDRAREWIPNFLEVHVECPLEICKARDPKGLYRKAEMGTATAVPGLQVPYELPDHPEVVVRGHAESPEDAVSRIIVALQAKELLPETTGP
jgi:adenylylsulfate kinase